MKNKNLNIRLTEKEFKMIDRKAEKAHLTKTEFVIKACGDIPITVAEGMQDVARQIHFLNNNINQLVILAHQGRISVVDLSRFREAVEAIWQLSSSLIKNVRRQED